MPQTATKSRAGASSVVVPNAPRWHQRLGAWLVFGLVKTVSATLRYEWTDRSGHFESGARTGPAIFCVWHNRLALSMIVYFGFIKERSAGCGLAAMVSASKDGGFLTGTLECFGVQPVRGSTSRRGPQALRELTTWARRGYDLALTPDGPRGPRYVVQDGIIALAQLTEFPIIPVSYQLDWKKSVDSWDGFQIPMPFSRCRMVFGPAIRVPRETSASEREQFRLRLEQGLKEITKD